jgi:hypothetical protein
MHGRVGSGSDLVDLLPRWGKKGSARLKEFQVTEAGQWFEKHA